MTSGSPSPLLDAFEHQDKIFSSAFSILQDAIARRKIPSASVAVTHQGRLIALKALGHFTPQADSPVVTTSTLFDLASLTKVVATTPMAMILYERGLLDLDAPVAAIVPEFTADAKKDSLRRDVTLRMLLAHSSGLPAYEKLYLKFRTRDELLHAAFTTPLTADPSTRAEYSDIGFIILGIALERLADETLDRFCPREVFVPLAMTNTTFNPPADLRGQIPPTADERESNNEPKCGAGTPAREMPTANHTSGVSHPPRSTFRQRIIQGDGLMRQLNKMLQRLRRIWTPIQDTL